MWPSIIEKAYAKLFINYSQMAYGWAHEAIRTLTNMPFKLIKKKDYGPDLFKVIKSYLDKDWLVLAGTDEEKDGCQSEKIYGLLC